MSYPIVTYYDNDGCIRGSVQGPQADIDANRPADASDVSGRYSGRDWYVVDGVPARRPVMTLTATPDTIPADGEAACTLSGVPAGATITSGEVTEVADGGDIEFVTDVPGEHRLVVSLWPYLDAEVVIHAV